MSNLLDRDIQYGRIRASNRLVMAPLTRLRAHDDGTATSAMAEYYAQRASVGMIVSEGIWPVAQGRAYLGQPGLQDDAHVASWTRVTGAVHAEGGSIVAQLMHSGRMSHRDISRQEVVGASPVAAPGTVRTATGLREYPTPRSLTRAEIEEVVLGHVRAAEHAIEAGFDGVELHAANGYLLHQFLSPNTNHRSDAYGGDDRNRSRIVREVVAAVVDAIGADRVGIRLSPSNNIHGIEEVFGRVAPMYLELAASLRAHRLAYVSLVHSDPFDSFPREVRELSGAPLIVNNGPARATDRSTVYDILSADAADAVVVGRACLANPDLLDRWREGTPENPPDETTFYTGGQSGYTDYPVADRRYISSAHDR